VNINMVVHTGGDTKIKFVSATRGFGVIFSLKREPQFMFEIYTFLYKFFVNTECRKEKNCMT
jgi:hypothetical protein